MQWNGFIYGLYEDGVWAAICLFFFSSSSSAGSLFYVLCGGGQW
jgi:hypothetical protein